MGNQERKGERKGRRGGGGGEDASDARNKDTSVGHYGAPVGAQ